MERAVFQLEYVDPAQRERQLRYDLATQFSELVDGCMRTNFELHFNGRDLISEDGRSLDETTTTGLIEAENIAQDNPNLEFEIRRRNLERAEFLELLEVASGEKPNTMIIISDFPQELMSATKDVGGYNIRRKQTMLRILVRQADGNLRMYSQSLDKSDRPALEAIYANFGLRPKPGELLGQRINVDLTAERQAGLTEELRGVYDDCLKVQYGGEWHAGRQPINYQNTYEFVCQQKDIINECVRLEKLGWLNNNFMYGVAAEMNKRFKTGYQPVIDNRPLTMAHIAQLHQEFDRAAAEARSRGQTFSACGITLGADGASENGFAEAGYGNKKAGEDQFGSLKFKCSNGHPNERPYGKLLDCCKTCGISVRC